MADDPNDPDRLRPDLSRRLVDPGLMKDLADAERRAGATRGQFNARSPSQPRFERFGAGVASRPAAEPAVRTIVELNPDVPGGLEAARTEILAALAPFDLGDRAPGGAGGRRYVFVSLTREEIGRLDARLASEPVSPALRIWRDQQVFPLLDRSVRTVKADVGLATFGADGRDVVVAVADSGIDGTHPHFAEFENLRGLPVGVDHRDFTGGTEPLADRYGHGTHVAGIVAGRTSGVPMSRVVEARNVDDESVRIVVTPMAAGTAISGVAPRAKIVSLKVLDDAGRGYASALIEALEHVHDVNDSGRRLRVHCVNLSLGYPFEAEWFAAGHSPLCEVVNRLSRSGVVVVAAAGNDGSMLMQTEGRRDRQRIGLDQSINDPGNADEAITVGATHAEAPHAYGVSYFSSRGPTADGRAKPDLVAPGERILSCAAAGSAKLATALDKAEASASPGVAYFREESGTSMAAPHVAGAVAALLSTRREFIGRPETVKAILVGSCTDLKRKADFQGAGLLDVLRALQSV